MKKTVVVIVRQVQVETLGKEETFLVKKTSEVVSH
jgi:hypothetical protein